MVEEYLYDWEDSVENFMGFVEFCCGIERETSFYQLICSVVKTQVDLNLFVDEYDGNINDLQPTIQKVLMRKTKVLHI